MFRVAHIRMGQARNEPHSFVLNSISEKKIYVLPILVYSYFTYSSIQKRRAL